MSASEVVLFGFLLTLLPGYDEFAICVCLYSAPGMALRDNQKQNNDCFKHYVFFTNRQLPFFLDFLVYFPRSE